MQIFLYFLFFAVFFGGFKGVFWSGWLLAQVFFEKTNFKHFSNTFDRKHVKTSQIWRFCAGSKRLGSKNPSLLQKYLKTLLLGIKKPPKNNQKNDDKICKFFLIFYFSRCFLGVCRGFYGVFLGVFWGCFDRGDY